MIAENDVVVLTDDLPAHGLCRGDVGAVVCVHGDHEAYEVEFLNGAGDTLAVVTVVAPGVRPIAGTEILHARSIRAA
jgi:Domain of unknown function (DUF4926)